MDIYHIMLNAKKLIQRNILATTLLCALLAAISPVSAQTAKAEKPTTSDAGTRQPIRTLDYIVAVVNKEVITKLELDERTRMIESRLAAQRGAAVPSHPELEKPSAGKHDCRKSPNAARQGNANPGRRSLVGS